MRDKNIQRQSEKPPTIPSGIVDNAAALGEQLRAFRQSKGWTLADAAALSGVGVRFLSELERGKPTAELGKALQVLTRFGLTVEVKPRR